MYGKHPHKLGQHSVECKEMLFYQYLPIKLIGQSEPKIEPRLNYFGALIGVCCCDFIGVFGLDRYVQSYIYLTVKHLFQMPHCSFNRPGYHSDGFMTDDINYIWSDKFPTVFNDTNFRLSMDDSGSLVEMEQQANPENDFNYGNEILLRLDQYNIHKVGSITNSDIRTFFKLSFSKDKYDLEGNSHNYLLDYKWEMKPRRAERNIPQTVINQS